MTIVQALVAAGGRGTRLDMPHSGPKSLLQLRGAPLLRWQLLNLHSAGIRMIVVAIERDSPAAPAIYGEVSAAKELFEQTVLFWDQGYGTHGLPHHAAHLLEDEFLFDAGHSLLPPDHYRRLCSAKNANNWVASVFVPEVDNPSRMTYHGRHAPETARGAACFALPYALDAEYGRDIYEQEFQIKTVFANRLSAGMLDVVSSSFPPEFDTSRERQHSEDLFEAYLGASQSDRPRQLEKS